MSWRRQPKPKMWQLAEKTTRQSVLSVPPRCYLAFSVPVLIAGYLARRVGVTTTADIYAGVIALLIVGGLAAIGLFGLSSRRSPVATV